VWPIFKDLFVLFFRTELFTLASQAREAKGKKKIENFIVLPTHLMDTLEDCTRGNFFFKPVTRFAFKDIKTNS